MKTKNINNNNPREFNQSGNTIREKDRFYSVISSSFPGFFLYFFLFHLNIYSEVSVRRFCIPIPQQYACRLPSSLLCHNVERSRSINPSINHRKRKIAYTRIRGIFFSYCLQMYIFKYITREKFSGISDNHLESSSSSSVSASGTHTPIMMRSPARGAVALTETTTSSASAPVTPVHNSSSSSSSATGGTNVSSRLSLFDTCHRKIRLFGELVAKARRKEKDAGATEDPKLYLEEAALERQLPELDLRMLVDLPAGLDYNEWLASHTLALFDHINLFYGTISEFCTMTGCPDMTGPGLSENYGDRWLFQFPIRGLAEELHCLS
nr:MOB kinase activator-like 2 isoform X3 [Neodiprion pinetum]